MLRLFADKEKLARAVSELFAATAEVAVARTGRFVVVLAGGSTPRRTYECLALQPLASRIPWDRCHFFWGDERCLPAGDQQRNEVMARKAFLDDLPVPPDHLHPIRSCQDPECTAFDYAAELQTFFGAEPPRFDLVLLGMGADGHTASLLPGSASLQEDTRWTAVSRRPEEPFSRVTLTVPLLNQAALAVVLVSGRSKAEVLHSVLEGDGLNLPLPVQYIRPADGELLWMVDHEAASLLAGAHDGGS